MLATLTPAGIGPRGPYNQQDNISSRYVRIFYFLPKPSVFMIFYETASSFPNATTELPTV